MFAAAVALAARLAPLAISAVTNPTVVKFAAGTAVMSAGSIALRTAKLQGQDKTAQATAEEIHGYVDPKNYADDPQRIANLRQRVSRNAGLLGQASATEVRSYRTLVTPPVHLAMHLATASAAKKVARLGSKMDAAQVGEQVIAPTPEMLVLGKKITKTSQVFFKRQLRLEKVRTWYQPNRWTPGEHYLANQVNSLRLIAIGNETRADSVEDIYIRLLDEAITSLDVTKPYEAGMAVHVAVTNSFSGDEIGIIRSRVLKPWLVRHHSVTDNQWRKFTHGWDAASRAAQTV